MPEITPNPADKSRCVSVHWCLPVQCVLPRGHRENWHEAWHPETGNRMRYRRALGTYGSEELHHGEWHDLKIAAPERTAPHVLAATAAREGALPMPVGSALTDEQLAEIDSRAAHLYEYVQLPDEADIAVGTDVPALLAEIGRLRAELARRTEDVAFLERATLPEMRRTIQHHQDGKKRWRDRAREAEAMVYELKRPAIEKRRNEIRSTYTALISQAEQDRDHEGAATLTLQLRDSEAKWQREDEEATS